MFTVNFPCNIGDSVFVVTRKFENGKCVGFKYIERKVIELCVIEQHIYLKAYLNSTHNMNIESYIIDKPFLSFTADGAKRKCEKLKQRVDNGEITVLEAIKQGLCVSNIYRD